MHITCVGKSMALLLALCNNARQAYELSGVSVDSPTKIAAALLLGSTSLKLAPALVNDDAPELCALKTAVQARNGDVVLAARDFAIMSSALVARGQTAWARRMACASASLMARDGDRATALLYCSRAASTFIGDELLGSLVFSARLRAEMGQLHAAERDLALADALFRQLDVAGKELDVRVQLARARVCMAQGKLEQASAVYGQVLSDAPATKEEETRCTSGESEESRLCAVAVASVTGYLGDFVMRGSRLARLEAANNRAVCALQLGQLDTAAQALESVCRADSRDVNAVDGIVASNLRTLYDLARTPEPARVPLPVVSLVKLG